MGVIEVHRFAVLVCGGRKFRDRECVWRALDLVLRRHRDLLVITGAAAGADLLAQEWCVSRAVPFLGYPADWKKHKARAGPMRNQGMIALGPDAVIAFPGGRGTLSTIRLARRERIPVWQPVKMLAVA